MKDDIMTQVDLIKKKIGKLLDDGNISHRAASLYIGKSESYINKFIKEKTPKRLDESDRIKLAKLLQVDEQELTDIDLSAQNKKCYYQEDLGEILETIEKWLDERNFTLDAKNRIKLMFVIYDELFSLPKKDRHTQ